MILILAGKSRKAKQRIQQHGNQWTVLGKQFCQAVNGEAFLVEAGTDKRWIRCEHDLDFEIIEIK